ncbi:SGNH/GDSL hydrolase family protein [Nocardioides sp. TRM66260-LWL]|uniref:SGNH/GDSL hydrolase family protein n=1 Tax=Nocardioides sp. TRM66260-LWL TaxID=2874478 RepID=UPI001CC4A41A|nr:SGNH/GDSL hydrolase family protein [Nocardioides sp. TRM66260-LWL]MBZ5735743.1 SGNH/GDSL hydrolase family protein [Nocardioides sp. TRM66260-LWL]
MPQPFRRYVALGDSFTEGVGDLDPTRPHGVRGWADRVADVLAAATPPAEPFGYANLAIRGRKLPAILAEQLDPALALAPDLVTLYAGGNDILRPRVDVDALAAALEDAVARLRAGGARVLVWTPADTGDSAIYRPLRSRFERYADLVRALAARQGADVVDFWTLREYRDPRYWSADRLHMGPVGHQRMAIAVLDVLGVEHDLAPLPLPPLPRRGRVGRVLDDARWTRDELGPWVTRRLTGRSSGDGLSPRYAGLVDPRG